MRKYKLRLKKGYITSPFTIGDIIEYKGSVNDLDMFIAGESVEKLEYKPYEKFALILTEEEILELPYKIIKMHDFIEVIDGDLYMIVCPYTKNKLVEKDGSHQWINRHSFWNGGTEHFSEGSIKINYPHFANSDFMVKLERTE